MSACDSGFDTQLWVGTGCPGSAAFDCTTQSSNDDTVGCGLNNWGSTVTFTANDRIQYILVGGNQGSGNSTFALTISYAGISWSATATQTSTPTSSGTRTQTRTQSSTRTQTGSQTGSSTQTPTQTAS